MRVAKDPSPFRDRDGYHRGGTHRDVSTTMGADATGLSRRDVTAVGLVHSSNKRYLVSDSVKIYLMFQQDRLG